MKRQKNDAADAEAICEAALRPSMRFVPVKSEDVQGAASVFRVRELLIRQRTQAINALRGHLTEFGEVMPKGAANVPRLVAIIEDPANGLPEQAVAILRSLVEVITGFNAQIGKLDAEIRQRARENEVARRLMTIPGIGPLIATALATLAPPPETFRRGRDFAAWLGLVPRQHSTGGKQRLGATTKMGERSLRRLLIIGANKYIANEVRLGRPRCFPADNTVGEGVDHRAIEGAAKSSTKPPDGRVSPVSSVDAPKAIGPYDRGPSFQDYHLVPVSCHVDRHAE